MSGLTICEQEQLINISCDGSLKEMFDGDKLPQLWLFVKNDCQSLPDKAIVKAVVLWQQTCAKLDSPLLLSWKQDIHHGW
jgi:hypothetical protein